MTTAAADVRIEVYAATARTGRIPTRAAIAASLDLTEREVAAVLGDLHDRHELVIGDDGEIRMALPFSAVPTPFVVRSGAVEYWANCAWDALAVPVALGRDAEIEAVWGVGAEPLRLSVRAGGLDAPDGLVHFPKPARTWWDDIVDT